MQNDFSNYAALITSIVAIGVSTLTLGWTIYRDAIRKPKFRVSIAVKRIFQKGRPPQPRYLSLDALNIGPIPNRISSPVARKSVIDRIFHPQSSNAFIYPDYGHEAATPTASRIEVGDKSIFVFPYDEKCFLTENFVQVGVTDGFGRTHWARRKELRKLRKKFLQDFPAAKRAVYAVDRPQ